MSQLGLNKIKGFTFVGYSQNGFRLIKKYPFFKLLFELFHTYKLAVICLFLLTGFD